MKPNTFGEYIVTYRYKRCKKKIDFTINLDMKKQVFWVNKGIAPSLGHVYSAIKEMWRDTEACYYKFPVEGLGENLILIHTGWHLKSSGINMSPRMATPIIIHD